MKTLWRVRAFLRDLYSGSFSFHLPPAHAASHVPAQIFLRVFYRFRFPAMGHPCEACFIMGRQESAAGPPHRGSRLPIRNLRLLEEVYRSRRSCIEMTAPGDSVVREFLQSLGSFFRIEARLPRPNVRFVFSSRGRLSTSRFALFFQNPSPAPRRPLALFFHTAFSATYRRQVGLTSSEPTGIGARPTTES
jgi:hypothetical protein